MGPNTLTHPFLHPLHMMLHHYLWCFVIVRNGLWWFVMVSDVSWWFVIVRHGSWCFIMVRDVSWWFIMVRDVSSWFVMVRHGSHDGSWCFSVMVSSWFVMVRDVLLSWFHHGSSWFVMFYSLKFSRKGHVTLYSANQSFKFTIKSHFWWDFLFSPFHLKSIPRKSSAKK